jgi:uncharacterized cupin superfamily protein
MKKFVKDMVLIGAETGRKNVPEYPEGSTSDSWNEVEWTNFGSYPDGPFFGGIWYGEPGRCDIDSFPWDEFCYMKKGRVRFVDTDGNSIEFEEGDGFLCPHEFSGYWEVLEYTEMPFVAIGPF